MNCQLNSYPAYRPSGVEWLGAVPDHWQILPNRAVFTEVNDQGHPDEQMLSVTIAEGVIRQQALLQNTSKKDSSRLDKSSYKLGPVHTKGSGHVIIHVWNLHKLIINSSNRTYPCSVAM